MSLITQCPACATMFRVVPDQLRISDGWVRCGQCDEVFDAHAHLKSVDLKVIPTAPDPEPEPLPEPETLAYDWGPTLSVPLTSQDDATEEKSPQEPESDPGHGLELPQSLEPQAPGLHEDSRFDGGWTATVYADPALREAISELPPPDRLDALVADPPPSFMGDTGNRDSTREVKHQPSKKVLAAVCVCLISFLLMQILLQERDRIAAASPDLEPVLVAACEALSCTVSPLRSIDSIAIDSSAFTSVRPGIYLLHLSLKNVAPVAVATPALELTLTDGQERAVLRRVVLPAELSGKRSVSPGAELSATLPISVRSGALPERIAGYKLLAFYP